MRPIVVIMIIILVIVMMIIFVSVKINGVMAKIGGNDGVVFAEMIVLTVLVVIVEVLVLV